MFFGYDFGPISLRYHVADRAGKLRRTVDIEKPIATMMHDFGVTQTRVIFMDLPVAFDMEMALQGAALPFRWRDDMPARLGILPRDATKDDVQWIEIDLQGTYRITEIRLLVAQWPEGDTLHYAQTRLSSTDGYTTVHEFAGTTADNDWLVFKPDVSLENVGQIRIRTISSPSWVAWKEIRVFGDEIRP